MKRTRFLEPLSHDHHHGLQATAHLRRELARHTPHEYLASYVADLWNDHLAQHFHDEEHLLLPLMATTPMRELGQRMVDEHRSIRELVDRIVADSPSREESLAQLPDVLSAHIRFEERELFPALESGVPEATLREVGDRLRLERPGG